MGKLEYQGLNESFSKEIIGRLMCPDCRAGLEYTQTAFRCLGCGRTFPVTNGVIQMMPASWLKSESIGLNQTDNISDYVFDRVAALKYEELRFRTQRSSRRQVWEQSIVSRFLKEHPEGIWVLDVPCGMGRFNETVARFKNKVLSIDKRLWRAAYTLSRTCGPSALAIQGDALSLPFRNNAVDVAICVRLTHHLNKGNISTLFEELGRVASEVLVTFYNADTFRAKYRRIKKMVRGKQPAYSYSLSSIRDMTVAAGLSIVSIYPQLGFRFFQRPIQFLHLKRLQS